MDYQFRQVQDYIFTLFDDLPQVELDNTDSQTMLNELLRQNIRYGKKIIEISDKFDQLYSQDRFAHQQALQQKLYHIYKLVTPEHNNNIPNVEHMINSIEVSLKTKLNSNHSNTAKSRTTSTNKAMTASSQKSQNDKQSQEQLNFKEILQVQESLQSQQDILRQIYEQIAEFKDRSEVTLPSDSHKLLKYECDSSTVWGYLKHNLDSNKNNLKRLSNLIEQMTQQLVHKLRKGSVSEAQMQKYIEEVEKREQVFSYTVSKVLESVRVIKNSVQDNSSLNSTSIQNLSALLSKLFDLYPSHLTLRDLMADEPGTRSNSTYSTMKVQEYITNSKEVQVNMKSGESKHLHSEIVRVTTRVNQLLRKYQLLSATAGSVNNSQSGSIHKKKEQDKGAVIVNQIKEVVLSLNLPSKGSQGLGSYNQDEQIIRKFQEEISRTRSEHETREKQLQSELQKTAKKYQKSISALQEELAAYQQELQKVQEKNHKLAKKLDSEKSEHNKLKNTLEAMAANLEKYQKEIDAVRDQAKSESREQGRLTKVARAEIERLEETLRKEIGSMQEERVVYMKKISLLEEKEDTLKSEHSKLQVELTQMISDNASLNEKLQDIARMFEEKVSESDELAQEYNRLEEEFGKLELAYGELKLTEEQGRRNLQEQEKELRQVRNINNSLTTEKAKIEVNLEKYKDLARLNTEDMDTLKEQLEKLTSAYNQCEIALEELNVRYQTVCTEREGLLETKSKYNKLLEEAETELRVSKRGKDSAESQISSLTMELQFKDAENKELSRQLETYKEDRRELSRLKKENSELKNSLNRLELQKAALEQTSANNATFIEGQMTAERTQFKATISKYQVEIETLKSELKNKAQTLDKERANFEREKNLQLQKINDLNSLLSEKEMISSKLKTVSRPQ